MAEFYMRSDDPRRLAARKRFRENVLEEMGVSGKDHHLVPYQGTALSAYRFKPPSPAGRLVVFGGFDSYIEEWFPMLLAMRDAGLDVVGFDGPGQGAALEEGVPMTPDWHLPVGAVLDYFGLADVTLLGFSLGGGLVVRAAAYEPRVRRVIAQDILTDFMACQLRALSGPGRFVVANSGHLPATIVNAAVNAARRSSMLVDWGMGQGLRVLGKKTPAEAFTAIRRLRTDDVSPLVTQDVLLMAGSHDHYVPVSQLGDQLATLGNAESVSARLFTEAEHASNHCQVGNFGLALDVILSWLDSVGGREARP